MNETNSKKESKSIATRISHKIQKTLGVSNKDILIEDKSVNRLIRSTKMIDLFATEEIPYVHKDEREEPEDDEKSCDKGEEDSKGEDEEADSKDESKEDDCQEICFREVQIVKITGCAGPTGPPGPILSFSNTFICLNRETDQILAKDGAIIWTSNTIKVGNINNVVNASGIYIWTSGYYMVYYNLCHKQPCQFSLFKNGIVINGSSSGSLQNSSFVIVRIDSSDFTSYEPLSPTGHAAKLEVVNHTSSVQNNQLVTLTGVSTISVVLLFEIPF